MAGDLVGLVALAGDEQRIRPYREAAKAVADRLLSVADLAQRRGTGQHRQRVIAAASSRARVVVRDDDDIGQPGSDLAHQRSLAGVAVAAAPKHDYEGLALVYAGRKASSAMASDFHGLWGVDRPAKSRAPRKGWTATSCMRPGGARRPASCGGTPPPPPRRQLRARGPAAAGEVVGSGIRRRGRCQSIGGAGRAALDLRLLALRRRGRCTSRGAATRRAP